MGERMVQVPESLIRDALVYLDESERLGNEKVVADLSALLSQPTPTAEPPRIEDMVPGTTFTARYRDPDQHKHGEHRFGIARNPAFQRLVADLIDPSTIRNVTPPKEA